MIAREIPRDTLRGVNHAAQRWAYLARITIGRDPATGKLKRVSFYGRTREDVAKQLACALHDFGQGTFVARHKVTVGEWLNTWLHEYKRPAVRPLTFDSYAMIVRKTWPMS